MACADFKPEQLVFVSDSAEVPHSQLRPSSEWHMHLAIYKAFADAGAIVHCHSRYATTLASMRKAIPPYHYMVAVAGGDDIPCADYATFGTTVLADNILAALEQRKACLMANHGQIAYAGTIEKALGLALQVEDLAAGYYQTLTLGGPVLLSQADMAEVLEKFQSYGAQPGTES
mgnify:CR=1 FL=1